MEHWAAPVVLGYMLCIALLVVSTVPTFSGKTMGKRVPRDWVLPIFLVVVAAFGLFISFPFEAMVALALGYLVTLPIGAAQYRRRAKAEGQGSAAVTASDDLPEPARPAHDRAVDS
jgi:CDP-diacylglycerol--serine O-phosphatidyltransferase